MIYLDNNSTTQVDDFVLEEMLPYFSMKYGNAASSTHQLGWQAKSGIETALERVTQLINCDAKEIVFTSGATESINLAIQGVFEVYKRKGNHIITCKTEHKAVLDTCHSLKKLGARITYLDVDENGLVDIEQLKKEISDTTILVSIMHVNNETGVIQPIHEIAEIVHQYNSIFMSDATQSVGKTPIDLHVDKIDLMPFSAHKFYGPKGVGALYVRRKKPRVILLPQIFGGGHQRGLRSGTMNVPGIVGLGAACQIAKSDMQVNRTHILALRRQLEEGFSTLSNTIINGKSSNRFYNTSNVCFENVAAVDIINAIKTKVAISTGSACSSEHQEPSHVLKAMGLSDKKSYASLRFSIGKFNTKEDIKTTIDVVTEKVNSVLG